MARREDIDHILRDWAYDPTGVNVRLVSLADGREVIQMRIDMGILQLETAGRPDGIRPGGHETYLDYLIGEAIQQGASFVMDEDQCEEVDREFVQFYHRRVCWLQLSNFPLAVRDAEHTLELMDFCRKHSPDQQWTLSHEQYRRFVLFHRTQAAALVHLNGGGGAELAIQELNDGLDQMLTVFEEFEAEEEFDQDELVQRLTAMREELRERFDVGRTLSEQLADAVASEQYELAARLRDKLAQRDSRH